jgi:hypothetical protein
MLMLGPMFEYLTGKHGVPEQILSGAVYTVSCVSGSLFAHFLAMKTEKGKNAVGYNKKYAQIPTEEWEKIRSIVYSGGYNEPACSGVEIYQKVAELDRLRPGWGAYSTGSTSILSDSSGKDK